MSLKPFPSDVSRHVLAAQRDIQTGQEVEYVAGAVSDRRTAYQAARLKLLAAVDMLDEVAARPWGDGGLDIGFPVQVAPS